MTESHLEEMQGDHDIDDTFPHPSPDELDLLSLDDPNLIEKLDQRSADVSGAIPWSELRRECP